MLLRQTFTASQQAEAGKPVFYLKVLPSGSLLYTLLLRGLKYVQLKPPTSNYHLVFILSAVKVNTTYL
ncbi:hypothetical protein ACRRTK_022844 [Alexandromys fortis]